LSVIAVASNKKAPQLLQLAELFVVSWWRFRDLNPGPADYDSVALTS
jgi:hypothetical protein